MPQNVFNARSGLERQINDIEWALRKISFGFSCSGLDIVLSFELTRTPTRYLNIVRVAIETTTTTTTTIQSTPGALKHKMDQNPIHSRRKIPFSFHFEFRFHFLSEDNFIKNLKTAQASTRPKTRQSPGITEKERKKGRIHWDEKSLPENMNSWGKYKQII